MRIILSIIFAAIAAPAPGQTAVDSGAPQGTAAISETVSDASEESPNLNDLLWVARPIVVFADTPNDPRFQQQLAMLDERADELTDRDVVVLIDSDPTAKSPLRIALRPRGFNLVLIDKDGSVVQRRPAPITARELVHMIDRLPSRRQEIGSSRQ